MACRILQPRARRLPLPALVSQSLLARSSPSVAGLGLTFPTLRSRWRWGNRLGHSPANALSSKRHPSSSKGYRRKDGLPAAPSSKSNSVRSCLALSRRRWMLRCPSFRSLAVFYSLAQERDHAVRFPLGHWSDGQRDAQFAKDPRHSQERLVKGSKQPCGYSLLPNSAETKTAGSATHKELFRGREG